MDKNYELKYHKEELKNWWFISRRNMLHLLFRKYNIPKTAHILDIGCAGGIFLTELQKKNYTNVYALDYSADAIALCKKNGIARAFVMDGHEPNFPPNTFDVIIASDSLEHLKDDQKALHNWNKVLKENGIIIVYVPAYMFLWSEHDDINYHFRRYTRKELVRKMHTEQFLIIKSGYWNMGIFLPTALVRLLQKLKKKNPSEPKQDQLIALPNVLTMMLVGWMKFENWLGSFIQLPFGVSTYAIVRKKNITAVKTAVVEKEAE